MENTLIEVILKNGLRWFKGTVVKNNGKNEPFDDQIKMEIKWERPYSDFITEHILQSLKDSEGKIVDSKYKIIELSSSPDEHGMTFLDKLEIDKYKEKNKTIFLPKEIVETNYDSHNFPFEWSDATIVSLAHKN